MIDAWDAILEHGGEAASSRREFQRVTVANQRALIAFLDNLVLFKVEEDEVVVPPPADAQLMPRFRRR
jgi:hypothetical protein